MLPGRKYSSEFHAVTVSAQQDLFYVKPAADKPVCVTSVVLAVSGAQAESGDSKEELLDVRIVRLPATVTVGSGGSANTPNPLMKSDAAAGCTVRINDTTKATTSGTALQMHSDGMNSRVPFLYRPLPEEMLWVSNAEALVVELDTTPAASLTMSGTIYFCELG